MTFFATYVPLEYTPDANGKKVICRILGFLPFSSRMVYTVKAIILLSTLLHEVRNSVAASVCPHVITVAHQARPPFVIPYAAKIVGSVATPLANMLEICCQGNQSVTYTEVTSLETPLMMQEATFVMPVARDSIQVAAHMQVKSRRFIPLQLGGGSLYVMFRDDVYANSNVLLAVFTDGYPYLLLLLLVAAYGALFMWLCDHHWNPRQFPEFCLRGVWEGIWWAIVTMTTVGYGDRIPRSCLARVIGFLVIIIGLVVCSLFTAAVTNALYQQDFPDLTGLKVGVLKDSVEYALTLTLNAKPIEIKTLSDVFAQFTKKNLDGLFIDIYTWRFHVTNRTGLNDTQIFRDLETFTYKGMSVYYGVVGKNISDDLWQCMATVSIDKEMERVKELSEGWTMLERSQQSYASSTLQRSLPISSNLAKGSAIAAGIWVLICAAVIILQCVYYRHHKHSIKNMVMGCNHPAQKPSDEMTDFAMEYYLTRSGAENTQSSVDQSTSDNTHHRALPKKINGYKNRETDSNDVDSI